MPSDLINNTAHLSFKNVSIIGNAVGDINVRNLGYTITFNSTRRPEPNVINICNGPFAGVKGAFLVTNSPDNNWVEQQLELIAKKIEPQLGCWPSTGLVTLILMSMISKQVNVERMALLPNLARHPDMPKDEHLPCIVHNWLGERRIALGLVLTQTHIKWPELFFAPLITPSDAEQVKAMDESNIDIANPFELLHKVDKKTDTPTGMMLTFQVSMFKQMATLSSHQWVAMASTQALTQVEMLFVEPNAEKSPCAWYFTHSQTNQYLDAIRHHLAYCQQLIAIASAQEKEKEKEKEHQANNARS
ncbi:hypothetical protein ACFOD0_14215 [Shewanella intestini]|uniref:Uncharacterized protein n=1 Tax=Shewanella intestini TaxID=2017544 RepID=A0ABS5I5B0_9GAMM|nr:MULTISPECIES: hypothetical protein [Shewanella]MBR9729018.1 hypothetical protein [Shewanella intestini]MRG36916.1 hypothetical protein [Shewanella sp. XMDDZSB0408]